MGNCGSKYDSKYCTELISEPLDADPDIVGPGVLAAFALTAIITATAITVGFFTDSLPDEHLNSLDFAVIDWFSASPIGKILHIIRSNFVPFLKKCLFFKSDPQPKKPLTKARREVAFEKFILALSDQQLVTGIAILVAVFANHCRTSIYELNIAISLAWFSSTTHLGTLDVLHRYFRENVVVRNWRMVGMVGVLFLLIPGLVLVEIYVFINTKVPMQCSQYVPDDADNGIGPLASVFVIVYLCVAYTSRLYKTFTSEDGSMIDPEWLVWKVLLLLFSRLPKAERHAIIEKAINVCNTRRTINVEQKLEALTVKRRFWKRLGLCIGAYSRSFLQLIAALFFLLSYGVSGVVADRWLDFHVDLEEGSSTMEFGQIVPLVLLILPLLAFAEIFYEKPDKTPESEKARAAGTHDRQSATGEKSHTHETHTLSTTTTASLPPHMPPSLAAGAQPDTAANHETHTAPVYAGFAKADIKSRLPRSFLDGSRRLILTIWILQILFGVGTGVLLNISGVGASGGAILICIPWVYNIASAVRRFTRVGKVIRGIRRSNRDGTGEEFEDVMASDSWEKMTDRKGRVCYVHHGVREARWQAPEEGRYERNAGT